MGMENVVPRVAVEPPEHTRDAQVLRAGKVGDTRLGADREWMERYILRLQRRPHVAVGRARDLDVPAQATELHSQPEDVHGNAAVTRLEDLEYPAWHAATIAL
jgi:hypothetical protein